LKIHVAFSRLFLFVKNALGEIIGGSLDVLIDLVEEKKDIDFL